jgi:hypothetical protein
VLYPAKSSVSMRQWEVLGHMLIGDSRAIHPPESTTHGTFRSALMREHVRVFVAEQIQLRSDGQEREACLGQGKPVFADQD